MSFSQDAVDIINIRKTADMDSNPINTSGRDDDIPRYEQETFRGDPGTQLESPTQTFRASSPPLHEPAPTSLGFIAPLRPTYKLGPERDEYLPIEIDDAGEKKVMPNGAICGGREYLCREFTVPNHGERLFMFAAQCAQVLGYRFASMLFSDNRTLLMIWASQPEKDELVKREILPPSYRSQHVALVTARSIFRQFGSLVIVNGRRVRDDYWETNARERGFMEAYSAGPTRPGAVSAREEVTSAVPDEHLLHLDLHLSGYEEGPGVGYAFKLYREHHEADVVAKHPDVGASQISEIFINLWRDETQEIRNYWKLCAGTSQDSNTTKSAVWMDPKMVGDASTDKRGHIEDAYRNVPVLCGPNSHNTGELTDLKCGILSAELPPVPPVGIGMDQSISSKATTCRESSQEVFARLLAHWNDSGVSRENLALLLSLGKHRPLRLPTAVDVGSTWQGWLRCEWELPSVVREMQESYPDDIHSLLKSFVTTTGSRSDMICSTCGQFLERHWAVTGTRALEVLSRGVTALIRLDSTPNAYCSTICPGTEASPDVEIHINDTHIIVGVGKEQPEAQSFIDAIVWICAAVRVNHQRTTKRSRKSQLQMSEATQLFAITGIVYVRSQALVYGLEPLTECSDIELGLQFDCWTGLFNPGTVAFCDSYHMEREDGEGLEIAFDMVVHLSGVENVYHFDGGIILMGFFTALVPISYDEDSEILQWHFEEISGSDGILKPDQLLSVRGKWYKTQNIHLLRSSRCFLGWFARANILLGTRQLVSKSQFKWSTETTEHRQTVCRDGFEIAGQFGFTAGPINTDIQLVKTWRFHSNVQRFHRQQQYSTALHLGHGNVSVIIDSESKQVWLVPMLSVILHLCHRYFQELSQGSNVVDNPLPFANPSPDGATAATKALESAGETLIFGSAGDLDAENLRQLFLRINSNLLNAAGTREPSNRKTLYASELMDMITEPGRGSPLKKMKAPVDAASWVDLFERVDFVGVCANIGLLIEPETAPEKSCTCSTLPSDRFLLAAHVRCLDVLSQREGSGITNSPNRVCRLGDKVFWSAEKVSWTDCSVGIHEPIWGNFKKDKVLQQISGRDKSKGKNMTGKDGGKELGRSLPVDGAVVFGADTSKRTLQSWRLSEYLHNISGRVSP